MKMTKYLFPAFIFVVLIQLYVPAKMIWDSNAVVTSGTTFKFKTQPIDPNDPFRGKYVVLNYEADNITLENSEDFDYDEQVYVTLQTDESGFAAIKTVTKTKPTNSTDYVTAIVNQSVAENNDSTKIYISYPFDRFYMEEHKAKPAEETLAEARREEGKTAYALIKVKNGQAVIEDVMIDNISVKEMVE
ncbi:MAG: GDYXXLXY domain-containing protein [Saprospiraceae bacterium]